MKYLRDIFIDTHSKYYNCIAVNAVCLYKPLA